MNPVNASSAGSSGGSPGTPTAAPKSAPGAADFLSLLGQLVGEPARQAITPIAAPALQLDSQGTQARDTELELPEEAIGLLPIQLPVVGNEASSSAAERVPSASVLNALQGAGRAAASGEARWLRDMIQGEQALMRDHTDASEMLHRPNAESAQAPKPVHVADAMLSRPVQVPVGSAQWADEIGARLTVLAQQGRHSASLRLSPEHLGPLEIRIAIREDQASVWFGAAHADTRAAIEHALPRLRELFESQGMSLADAGVYHESPRERLDVPFSEGPSALDSAAGEPEAAQRIDLPLGLIDAYA